MRNCFFAIILLSLSSCFKEELPVTPMERGEVITNHVELGSNYATQAYFDLGSNQMVFSIHKEDWDIAFDCSSGNLIRQNTALAANAGITDTDVFDDVNSSTSVVYRSDYHDGNPDSLGMGKWFEDGKVIIIDRGYALNGTQIGKLKFQMISLENGVYTFRYSKLNGSDYHEASVAKNEDYNYIGYSFKTHSTVYHQPKKKDYDICFSGYTHIFYEPEYTPYAVVGGLTNPYLTEVARDENNLFSTFDYNALDTLEFSTVLNTIGYDWKTVNITTGKYTVFPYITYIIHDSEGYYYKLHFIDYYNDQGERGCPTFEFQRL